MSGKKEIHLDLSDSKIMDRIHKFYSAKRELDIKYDHPHLTIFNHKLGGDYSSLMNIDNATIYKIFTKYEDTYEAKYIYETDTRTYEDPTDSEGWGITEGDFLEFFTIDVPTYLLDPSTDVNTSIDILTREYHNEYVVTLERKNNEFIDEISMICEHQQNNTDIINKIKQYVYDGNI